MLLFSATTATAARKTFRTAAPANSAAPNRAAAPVVAEEMAVVEEEAVTQARRRAMAVAVRRARSVAPPAPTRVVLPKPPTTVHRLEPAAPTRATLAETAVVGAATVAATPPAGVEVAEPVTPARRHATMVAAPRAPSAVRRGPTPAVPRRHRITAHRRERVAPTRTLAEVEAATAAAAVEPAPAMRRDIRDCPPTFKSGRSAQPRVHTAASATRKGSTQPAPFSPDGTPAIRAPARTAARTARRQAETKATPTASRPTTTTPRGCAALVVATARYGAA
jgi:hypothetical protein